MVKNMYFSFDDEQTYDQEIERYLGNFPKDSRDIKKNIKVEQNYFGTYTYALAVHDGDLNKKIELPATHGTPLTPEVHDIVRDVYCLEGVDFYDLGWVPIGYYVSIEELNWGSHIPLPLSVIKRYITESEKKDYFSWSAQYKKRGFQIKFIQLLGN